MENVNITKGEYTCLSAMGALLPLSDWLADFLATYWQLAALVFAVVFIGAFALIGGEAVNLMLRDAKQ
jgi:hypothetical protein